MLRPSPMRERGADEREVGERLREVAELAAGDRVVFLGEQADVVAEVEQPLEQLARLVVPALQRQHLDEPERAGEEDALAGGQPVDVAVVVRAGSGSTSPSTVSSRRIASTVETNRSSSAGRNPTSGISRTLASSSSEP